jgi:hypothetical protein
MPRLNNVMLCPSATAASTRAGPRKKVPPRTNMRLGVTFAREGIENKDEHAEAAVAMSERFMKFLRFMDLLFMFMRRDVTELERFHDRKYLCFSLTNSSPILDMILAPSWLREDWP